MIDIQEKKEKALKGREIWLAIKTKYEIYGTETSFSLCFFNIYKLKLVKSKKLTYIADF